MPRAIPQPDPKAAPGGKSSLRQEASRRPPVFPGILWLLQGGHDVYFGSHMFDKYRLTQYIP